jgi:hypothetical protein
MVSPALLTLSLVAVSFKPGPAAGAWALARTATAKIPRNVNSVVMNLVGFSLVVMGHSSFHLMLLVLHVFGFFVNPGLMPGCCTFVLRREQGNHLFEILPFRMAARTCRHFDCGRHHEMFKSGTTLSAFVFKYWHRLIILICASNST